MIGILINIALASMRSPSAADRNLFKDALRKLIQYDPEKRPNMDFFLAQATFEEAKASRSDAKDAAKKFEAILVDRKKRNLSLSVKAKDFTAASD